MHWLSHFFGLDNLSGPFYGFWSGAGSDITELALLGAVWHHVNCHEPGCWRPGTRVTAGPGGVHVRRCARHHHQHHTNPEGATR